MYRIKEAILGLNVNFYSKKSCVIVTKIHTYFLRRIVVLPKKEYLKIKYPFIYQGVISWFRFEVGK